MQLRRQEGKQKKRLERKLRDIGVPPMTPKQGTKGKDHSFGES